MSQSLSQCRIIPGWVKPFLYAIADGHIEEVAARMAGVGVQMVKQQHEKDSEFRAQYLNTWEHRRQRPGRGAQ